MQYFPSPFTGPVTFLHYSQSSVTVWHILAGFSFIYCKYCNENRKNVVSGVDSAAMCPFVEHYITIYMDRFRQISLFPHKSL